MVISHAETHKKGIENNHGDSAHLWRQLGMGHMIDRFCKDVKSAMDELEEKKETDIESEKWYRVHKKWTDS